MVLGDFQPRVGRHLVFESVLVFRIISEENVLVDVEHAILDVLLSKSSEQLAVQIVSDTSSIEHLANHVFQHCCVDLLDLVLLRSGRHQVVEVLLDEHQRSLQIRVVVFVRHAPSQRTELAPFNDD